jgi:hypothetical protein
MIKRHHVTAALASIGKGGSCGIQGGGQRGGWRGRIQHQVLILNSVFQIFPASPTSSVNGIGKALDTVNPIGTDPGLGAFRPTGGNFKGYFGAFFPIPGRRRLPR